jgi:hypothetical protein
MACNPRFVISSGTNFANKRLLLRFGARPPQQSLVFPWEYVIYYKGVVQRGTSEAQPWVNVKILANLVGVALRKNKNHAAIIGAFRATPSGFKFTTALSGSQWFY